jgi:hypothetical protein
MSAPRAKPNAISPPEPLGPRRGRHATFWHALESGSGLGRTIGWTRIEDDGCTGQSICGGFCEM